MSDENDPWENSYKPGNTAPDGNYIVGKNKPPESGKFREGDGRKRGPRKKGTKNLATDFREEMSGYVSVSINGKPRRVSRQRAILMRLADNASRGQHSAIKTVMAYSEKYGVGPTSADEGVNNKQKLPGLKNMTLAEKKELDLLLCKALDIEPPEPAVNDDPLAYTRDPEDRRNYCTEMTVEGIHLRHCTIPDIESQILEIKPRAYVSAALPRPDGCCRRRF